MTVFVKICGVTDEAALDAAVEAGADAVGFVFHGPSPRDIAPARAAELARRLPGGVLVVAVTMHPSQADVDRVLEVFQPGAWQTDAVDFDGLRLPDAIQRWPVLRNARGGPLPPRLVFDAPVSGRGRRARWSVAAAIARSSELILGGGLDAENVAEAILAVRPFGVDVSSGVERAPGVKDVRRIQAFIEAARTGVAA